MKLITNYKDFYDYNIGLYGIDEKVVYNRLPLEDNVILKSDLKFESPKGNPFGRQNYNDEWQYARLLFCGRWLPIRRKNEYKSQYEFLTQEMVSEILKPKRNYWWYREYEIDYHKKFDFVMQIHKLTKQPVLVLGSESNTYYRLDQNIPVLQNIKGFASFMDAKQTFLEITQCIIDINNTESAPAMADTDKIVSHGFDKKISFRHRK